MKSLVVIVATLLALAGCRGSGSAQSAPQATSPVVQTFNVDGFVTAFRSRYPALAQNYSDSAIDRKGRTICLDIRQGKGTAEITDDVAAQFVGPDSKPSKDEVSGILALVRANNCQ